MASVELDRKAMGLSSTRLPKLHTGTVPSYFLACEEKKVIYLEKTNLFNFIIQKLLKYPYETTRGSDFQIRRK
jgi:hypothetical protein